MYVSHHVYDLLTAHMAAQLLFYSETGERKAFYLKIKRVIRIMQMTPHV
ncbi:hypothetical protein BACI9J_120104 [Bacillus altitudinis]|nr:hypothetical protein BACI9J_120104 [Bacillus altitudinis]